MDFSSLLFTSTKGKKLTKNQSQWNTEIKNLQRRVMSWEKTKGLIFQPDIKKPKVVRQKNLQEVKRITLKSLSDKTRYQEAYIQQHPSITFEQAEIFGYRGVPLQQVVALKNDKIPAEKFAKYPELLTIKISYEGAYEPRTEGEWESESEEEALAINWIEPEYPNYSVDEIPVVQEYELQEFIQQFINELTNNRPYLHENAYKATQPGRGYWYQLMADEAANKLKDIVLDKLDEVGHKNFYAYLSNPGVQESLLDIARRIYGLYLTQDNGTYEQQRNTEAMQFAQLLNMGKPLSDEQKMQLEEEELEL